MSWNNFKPTIWSRFIQQELDQKAKLVDFCNRKFEGEAKKGETVRILNAPSPTIKNYVPGVDIDAPEAWDGIYTELKINQMKYFNFGVDDVDRMQSIPGMMEAVMIAQAKKMLVEREVFVGSLATEATHSSASTQIGTAAAAKKAVDAGLLVLRENGVSVDDDVHIELAPFVYQLLRDSIVEVNTNNVDIIHRGVVGMYDGALVVLSNNLHKDETDTYCMIRTKDAIAFASGIDELEAYRPEKGFADAVKGLNVFGGKLVRPDELYVIKAHK